MKLKDRARFECLRESKELGALIPELWYIFCSEELARTWEPAIIEKDARMLVEEAASHQNPGSVAAQFSVMTGCGCVGVHVVYGTNIFLMTTAEYRRASIQETMDLVATALSELHDTRSAKRLVSHSHLTLTR